MCLLSRCCCRPRAYESLKTFYRFNEDEDLTKAVDLEVVKTRLSAPSHSGNTETRNGFAKALLERDVCCVWTGAKVDGEAMHIFPFTQGSEVCSAFSCAG